MLRIVLTLTLLVVPTSTTESALGEELPVPVLLLLRSEPADGGELPRLAEIVDEEQRARHLEWLENDSARIALRLYRRSCEIRAAIDGVQAEVPPFVILVTPGGNRAKAGYRLVRGDVIEPHPERPYVELDSSPDAFETTLLHETGHVLLAILSSGQGVPVDPMASIPHSTAALTDRGTAFNEGFAIHLETLAAHLRDDVDTRGRYRHERFEFGEGRWQSNEYFRPGIDVASYAQNIARYREVRDNSYAFAPACRKPDYLRVQLDNSRDFATLLDANQLLQSEGFYATFFFSVLMRGDETPAEELLAERQDRMLAVLARMFDAFPPEPDSPHLLRYVESFRRHFPDAGEEVSDALLDLSHGVFIDERAAKLWNDFYLAALRLDVQNLRPPELIEARRAWRDRVRDDVSVLYHRLGPQIPCMVEERSVTLVAFGGSAPLFFDLNTVQEGIVRWVPEIRETDVSRWLAERARSPFQSAGDFTGRMQPAPFLAHLQFDDFE